MANVTSEIKVKKYSLKKFGIENLSTTEASPESLKENQVRVKIHAASLNYRDLLMVKGLYDPNVLSKGALIPLSDGAGEVVEVATGVDRFKIGDRVAGTFFQQWLAGDITQEINQSALGGSIDGVLCNYKIFNQDGLVKIPENCSYEEGATLPCAALTAWHALILANKLKAGETVLLQGTGGVSIFALQFAKMSGARVILTSSSNEKLSKAKELGADYLINYKNIPDWAAEAKKITDGRGVDHIIEVGGANTLAQSLKAVKHGGKIAVIGILSGTENCSSILPVLMKAISIQGIYVGSREMFESMNKAISMNKMHPVIDKVFSFEQSSDALRYLESGSHFGKVVIKIS